MFVSFYAMFNIYMYVIGYLYSPAIESLEDLQFKQTRKEHEHIMNQFYEQELPDISQNAKPAGAAANGEDPRSKAKSTTGDRQKLTGGNRNSTSVEKRRYLKKDPEQKAKDVIT
jgi:hypothetical protein